MRLNSKEAGDNAVATELHKLQRMAEVRKASNRLQGVMGIEPGAKLVDDQAVQLWEMPQKPKSFMHTFQGAYQKGYVGDATQEHKVSHEGGSGATVRHRTSQTMNMISASAAQPRSDIELPQIIVTDVDGPTLGDLVSKRRIGGTQGQSLMSSPDIDPSRAPAKSLERAFPEDTAGNGGMGSGSTVSPSTARHQQQAEQSRFLPPISPSAQPASPPISFAQAPSPRDRLPIYWDWLLSQRINDWLDDDSTLSIQTELSTLTLNNTLYKAQDFEKLKLTRLTICPTAQTERSKNPALSGPPEQRDWFVFEAQHKNVVLAGMEVDEEGEPIMFDQWKDDRDPEDYPEDYWLLAFPVCAVASTMAGKSEVVDEQVTVWKVGKEGFVPSVHGRGVEYEFLRDFVKAFAAGKARIEFASAA